MAPGLALVLEHRDQPAYAVGNVILTAWAVVDDGDPVRTIAARRAELGTPGDPALAHGPHVGHESPKNFQLDLFTTDDGHFEYSAVATNLPLDLPALYAFICGRGAQEKTIAELKGEFALDVIPTRHYGANSAWQQLSILAHNLIRSFQLDTLATPKPRSRKRTYTYLIRSMRTLRFLLVPGPAGSPVSAVATSCAWLTTRPRRPSMDRSLTAWPPELFSDWG